MKIWNVSDFLDDLVYAKPLEKQIFRGNVEIYDFESGVVCENELILLT